MSKKAILFLASIALCFSLTAQEVPEVQKSLISKVAATWCSNCGSWGWTFFEDLIADNSANAQLMTIHHSGDLANPTAQALTDNFNVNYQPRFILNNDNQSVNTSNMATKRTEIANQVAANAAQSPMANVGLTVTINNNELTIHTLTRFFQDASGEYYLGLYLVEDGIVHYQASIGNGAVHKHVLRGSVGNNHFGEMVLSGNITAGMEAAQTYVATLNQAWNVDNLSVAAVLWKKEGDSYQFVNTNSTNTFETPSNTTDPVAANWQLSVQPTVSTGKGGTIVVDLPNSSNNFELKLYDQLGQLVEVIHQGTLTAGQHRFDVNTVLDAGFYQVVSTDGKERLSRRMVVQ